VEPLVLAARTGQADGGVRTTISRGGTWHGSGC